ncbi:hypothetical protein DEO72_LG8g2320 [Vigna unguiculata]|uniref:Uncharacterized protein n=1 Tax=Vigna unguiculata TaxID=3917 RepID=A0A4D6MWN0_VIGUN|nr:hypothetical protein DEO72_LG8g2320 [Vigna unguiculata]
MKIADRIDFLVEMWMVGLHVGAEIPISYFDVTRYDVGVWTDVKSRKYRTLKGFFVLVLQIHTSTVSKPLY